MNTTQQFSAETVPTKEPSTFSVSSFLPDWTIPHGSVAQVNDAAVLSMEGVSQVSAIFSGIDKRTSWWATFHKCFHFTRSVGGFAYTDWHLFV